MTPPSSSLRSALLLGVLSLMACTALHAQGLRKIALFSTDGLPDAPSFQTATPVPGSIEGVVLDIQGDPVLNATVTLKHGNQTAERTATSGEDGHFLFNDVGPGRFQLTIHAPGLETFVSPPIDLHAGEHRELQRISLPLAGVNTDVQVTVTQVEVAQEQVKLQEQQRVFGVFPNFYTSYVWNAAPLNTRQKFDLAIHSILDPVDFVVTGGVAGVQQAADIYHGYGQGVQGYAKRYGANFADGAIGRMLGSAILPSVLHQDPRYFYQGTGTTRSRVYHALSSAVITRGDKGNRQPNYSKVLGSFGSGAISNAYHPEASRGVRLTLTNGLIDTAGNALSNLIREFVLKDFTPKVPSYANGKP